MLYKSLGFLGNVYDSYHVWRKKNIEAIVFFTCWVHKLDWDQVMWILQKFCLWCISSGGRQWHVLQCRGNRQFFAFIQPMMSNIWLKSFLSVTSYADPETFNFFFLCRAKKTATDSAIVSYRSLSWFTNSQKILIRYESTLLELAYLNH